MSSGIPSNVMNYIQSVIPGLPGYVQQQQPTYSDGQGFDVWSSGANNGIPTDFMNFSQMGDPTAAYTSQQAMPSGGYPGFVGFSPQANFPFPITQGPFQTQPAMSQDGYNWAAVSGANTTDYSQSFNNVPGGYSGFVGFSPQVSLPFPITQGPYQTQPTYQGSYGSSGYSQYPDASGGYSGFVGYSPQVSLPFPIQQGAYQTQPTNQYYTDPSAGYWQQAMPTGY